jgi:hypothetical protein
MNAMRVANACAYCLLDKRTLSRLLRPYTQSPARYELSPVPPIRFGLCFRETHLGEGLMAFYAFYVVAITILVLHFTGWLKRNNLEWIVLALAVATFPAVIFLR